MRFTSLIIALGLLVGLQTSGQAEKLVDLFDGQSLSGWEGNLQVWRVHEGVIVGGTLQGNPQNEFLVTSESYRNFVLELEYRLTGVDGSINGGVQFRSERIQDPANEMRGYQADIGMGHSGSLYDESRRKRTLMQPPAALVAALEKPGDWNRYKIHADGPRIRLFLNGELTVDYTEQDRSVEMDGRIGLQIHGKSRAQIEFRNIRLKRLPDYQQFKPLSPEESAAKVTLPPGYRLDVVAAEPMIQEPVWVAWDGNGAMYVAEMNSYMQDVRGMGTKSERNGRIKRLVDTDGDGIMDQMTIFVDHLLLPRMILALDERILVQETDSSGIISYRDSDGDGVADERIVLYQGTPVVSSVEHQDSALTWNLDNWIYTAQGGHRFRFTGGRWETERILEDIGNQWGLGMDDTGMMYYSQNSVPGRYFNQHWYYWNLVGERKGWRFKRFRFAPETDALFQRVYRTQPVGDRFDVARSTWTSASGLSIYRGNALPDEFYGNLFLAEPCAHAVRRAVVTRGSDGRRVLRNAYDDKEFFMSEDFYCRPVSTHTGPDGCLYVVDMYRGVIQDAPWINEEFAKRIKGMRADEVKGRGRIYRISSQDWKPGRPPSMLSALPEELVKELGHANGWWRDMAQRLLILRGDRTVIAALEEMALTDGSPLARLHALWTLEGLDALRPALLEQKLSDPDHRLRAAAIRLHEPALRDEESLRAVRLLASMARDPDSEVRRQLILSLGWSKLNEALTTIQDIVRDDPSNSILTIAALTALYGRDDLPLVKSVKDGSLFAGIGDESARERAETLWKMGLESWEGEHKEIRASDRNTLMLVESGFEIYQNHCAACHGTDGRGVVPPGSLPLAPMLADSSRVLGPKEALVRILLHGLAGPIEGARFEGEQMAPLGAPQPNAWTASVLSYIRQAWGNDAPPILPADVALIRDQNKGRERPWTVDELAQFSGSLLVDREHWEASGSGHFPQNAIDGLKEGSHRHAWYGANNPGIWLAVDLKRSHLLTHVVMLSPETEWAPDAYKIELSVDGKLWSKPVATGKGAGLRTLASFEPTMARHVRITQTGNSISRWVVSELEFYGSPIKE